MSRTSSILFDRLREHLEPHGAVSEFSRKTGIPRRNLDNWLSGTAIPVEAIDTIAAGMGVEPWELLKPPNTPELQKTGPKLVVDSTSSLLGDAVRLLAGLDDHELRTVLPYIETAPELAATTRLSQNKKLSQDGS